MTDRRLWADYAKGIGIILVVLAHVARGVQSAGLVMDLELYHLIDGVIYSFHMPLFFFLSGLFIVDSLHRRGSCRLVVSKLDSIVYPYIVWSLIQGTIEALLSKFTNGNVAMGDVAALLWQPRAHFWFLYALFFVTLLAIPIYRRLNGQWYFAVGAVAAVVSVCRDGIPGGVPLNFLYQYFVFFALGVSVATPIQLMGDHARRLSLILIPVLVIFQLAFHGPLHFDHATPTRLLTLGLAVVSIAAVVAVSLQLEKTGPGLLARIGNDSLAIYLMHILAGSGTRIVLQKLMGIDSAAIHLLLGTIAGLGLPLLAVRTLNGGGLLLAPPRSLSMSAMLARYCTQNGSVSQKN